MKIIDYIKNSKQYIYDPLTFDPFADLLESKKHDHYLIFSNSMLSYIHKQDFEKLFEKYNLVEIFDLSNCFLGTGDTPHLFLHITKGNVKQVKIAVFDEPSHIYRDDYYNPYSNKRTVANEYRREYVTYLEQIDKWRVRDVFPEKNMHRCCFRAIPSTEFRKDIINPRFYLEPSDEIRNVLKNDEIKVLFEVADIVRAAIIQDSVEIGRVVGNRGMPEYPYIPEKECEKYPITNVQVHKGDILENRGQFFLLDKEPAFELYAAPGCHVIRAKEVSPEYLYIYLKSKIAFKIRMAFSASRIDKMPVFVGNIEEFPVVLPQNDAKYYEELFEKISNPDERFFESLKMPDKKESVADVLDLETLANIKLNNEKLLRTHIDSDIEELKICYDNKAYKALVIMAGAILEAFLIDWKSEIDQINYFKTDLIVTKKDGSTGKADLADYIYLLYKEYEPKWNRTSKKAHMIREKRNRVHVKVCLSKTEDITKELCLEIIDNLKEIVESREKMTT